MAKKKRRMPANFHGANKPKRKKAQAKRFDVTAALVSHIREVRQGHEPGFIKPLNESQLIQKWERRADVQKLLNSPASYIIPDPVGPLPWYEGGR